MPPKNRRFLAYCEQRGYQKAYPYWKLNGYAWAEVYWRTDKFAEESKWAYWCGSDNIMTTDTPHFDEWMELPR